MRAGVWLDRGRLECTDWPEPRLREDDVLVEVAYCGMCGSDSHIVEGNLPIGPPPQVLGHEVSGVVVEVGSRVRSVAVGQRVACNFFGGCGSCDTCRRGLPNLCRRKRFGAQGYAEHAAYRADLVHPIPDDLRLRDAALLEPLATALYAVEQSGLRPGESALVIGGGPVGLLTAAVAKRVGAANVVVSEPLAHKREMALQMGADEAWSLTVDDLVPRSLDATSGRGFDVAFDAAGVASLTEALPLAVAPGGRVLITAVHAPATRLAVSPFLLYERQVTLTSAFANNDVFDRALALLPSLGADRLITAIEPLEDISTVYSRHRSGEYLKVLVQPGSPSQD